MEKDFLEMLNTSRPCLTPKEVSKYLKNNLTEEERFAVENHLLDCELCSAALEGYSQATIGVPVINVEKLRHKITPSVKPVKAPPSAKVIALRKYMNWGIAAGLLFLIGFSGAKFYKKQFPPDLFADYYQPYDKALLATRSSTDDENPLLTQGLEAYEQKAFSESLDLLEKAKLEDPENALIALYAGMAAMEAGAYQKAANLLSEARINHVASYATATWYLAMNYLAQKDFPSCRNMLKQLGPGDAPYYDQAQDLLQNLNK